METEAAAHFCLQDTCAVARGETLVPLERKPAAIVAYLAIEGPTPRGRLAGLLWPEVDEARARGNLRQCLSKLRRIAGDAVQEDAHGRLVLAAPPRCGDAAQPDVPLLGSYDYADCDDFSAWLEGQRDARLATLRRTLRAAVRSDAEAGRLDAALAGADRLLAIDRESEEAYRTLMEVCYLRADLGAAIAAWDRCRDMLRRLYGVAPSPATQALGDTLLRAAGNGPPGAQPRADAIPVTLLRPPRLIGREAAWQALDRAWRAGEAVCVAGESGLGKTRLLGDFAARLGRAAIAAARPGDVVLPYTSLSRLVLAAIDRFDPPTDDEDTRRAAGLLPPLAALVPVAEPPRTEHERAQALFAVGRVLGRCAERGCAAFVVDDLQYADTASLAALELLADPAAIAVPALRFAFGARIEDLSSAGQALLDALARTRQFSRIDLAPLREGEVVELVDSLALPAAGADGRALAARVGGNPAFVLESLKLLLSDGRAATAEGGRPLPQRIEAVIERRLALLSPRALHIAQLAAVAGADYALPLAARALGCAPFELAEPLRELELRQVLYGRAFVHDVIADVVRAGTPVALREMLHRLVAEDLDARGGEPAVAATHWQACGETLTAARRLLAAARRARADGRTRELCAWLDAAAAGFRAAGARAELFVACAERLEVADADDRVQSRPQRIAALEAMAVSEEERLVAAAARLEWQTDHSRTGAEQVAAGERGLARAVELGRPDLALRFAVPLAWQLAMADRADEAIALLDSQRAAAPGSHGPRERAKLEAAMAGVLGYADRLVPAIAASGRAIAALAAAGAAAELLPVRSNLGLLHHWRGDLDAAKAALQEAAELRDRIEGRGSAIAIDIHLGAVLRDRGEFAAALERLLPARAVAAAAARSGGDATDLVMIENHLAPLWLMLGRPDRAEAALETPTDGVGDRFVARRLALRLRIARRLGHPRDALREAAADLLRTLDSPFNRVLLELEAARDDDAPRTAFERLLALDLVRERPGLQLHVGVRLAKACLDAGAVPAARQRIDEVLALDRQHAPFDIERGEVWTIAMRVLAAAGARGDADAVASRAARWLGTVAGALPAELREGFLQHALHRALRSTPSDARGFLPLNPSGNTS